MSFKIFYRTWFFFYTCFLISFQASSQNYLPIIESYLERNHQDFGLSLNDLNDLEIDSYHYAKSTGTYNVYVIQRYQEIEIFNSIGVFAIKDNEVAHAKPKFEKNLRQRITNTSASISPADAIVSAAQQFQLGNISSLNVINQENNHTFLFSEGGISHDPIPVKLVWQSTDLNQTPERNATLRLAWDLSIHALDGEHWWSVRIDAETGELISAYNWMLSCSFENHTHGISQAKHVHQFDFGVSQKSAYSNKAFSQSSNEDEDENGEEDDVNNAYKVYPMPVESPNHGDRVLVINPADEVASPFGWHDTDGEEGAEHTITRGNNVWAQEDRNANNGIGHAPDGGENLVFDYPLNFDAPPAVYEDAAITNLFYWNNVIHDVWYRYGFDEVAGNFQQNNYDAPVAGGAGDFVFADAQDGSGINNANFATPPDGANPRMQMFLWNTAGQPNPPITVNSPESLAGDYSALIAAFGPFLSTEPITSDIVLVEDNFIGENYLACGTITNASQINGKIALIKRGECTFVEKVLAAQNAGAIAVVVFNNVPGQPITMGGSSNQIVIPSLMITQANGNLLVDALENDTDINMTIVDNGPFLIDGDYDNGIIAHEYGHGISTRLTGGRFQANCLFNAEQMGEGWSDWIGLVMTMTSNDVATQGRGYGTFAVNQSVTGGGIRPTPYSTDTSVSPFTYGITNNPGLTVPHGIGYMWAQMLWDLTWALIDEYGFDSDLYTGNGGNNIAIQLVTDGLKLQSCSPGFVDGRDAILAADELANDGANKCLIWEVFAARGLGWSADQGSPFERNDQVEAFDMPPASELDCETFSTIGFEEETLKVWPNPAQNRLHIQLQQINTHNAQLELFDLNGRKVLQQKMQSNGSQVLEVGNLQKGVYLLKVFTSEGNYTEKVIIQ